MLYINIFPIKFSMKHIHPPILPIKKLAMQVTVVCAYIENFIQLTDSTQEGGDVFYAIIMH